MGADGTPRRGRAPHGIHVGAGVRRHARVPALGTIPRHVSREHRCLADRAHRSHRTCRRARLARRTANNRRAGRSSRRRALLGVAVLHDLEVHARPRVLRHRRGCGPARASPRPAALRAVDEVRRRCPRSRRRRRSLAVRSVAPDRARGGGLAHLAQAGIASAGAACARVRVPRLPPVDDFESPPRLVVVLLPTRCRDVRESPPRIDERRAPDGIRASGAFRHELGRWHRDRGNSDGGALCGLRRRRDQEAQDECQPARGHRARVPAHGCDVDVHLDRRRAALPLHRLARAGPARLAWL